MTNLNRILNLTGLTAFAFGMVVCVPAGSAQVPTPTQPRYEACGVLKITDDQRITLPANAQVATRINFPSPLTDVSNSVPGLWDDFVAPTGATTFWARPRTTTAAGATAGVGLATEDGRAYDFVFEVAEAVPTTSCWTIADARPVPGMADRLQALENERSSLAAERQRLAVEREDQRQRTAALNRAQSARITALSDTAAKQARDAISAFKYTVTTAYSWSYSEKIPPFQISAAFDDGRSTYVRILSDAHGAPAVIGRQGEDVLALNYSYDDLTGVYTIQGLHDRIELRFGGVLAVVERKQ